MSEESVRIEAFDGPTASDADCAAWNVCGNLLRAEGWPDDPPESVEKTTRGLRTVTPFEEIHRWAAWGGEDGRAVVGQGSLYVWHTGTNEHAAYFHLIMLPQYRRRGLGTRMLAPVVDAAAAANRRLLLTNTGAHRPEGEAFMRRLGGKVTQTEHTNQLDLRDLNRDLLRVWQERARERASSFQLGWWIGPYPEECLDDVVAMKEATNLMPRGDVDLQDDHLTPERIRENDANMLRQQYERWTLYARDPETGRIAGYTEVWWHPENPETLHQDDTAVFKEYQGRGLARWLKAAMLERALRERPQLKRVRTGNADCNAPMLKINHELGFKPYRSHTSWQIELEQVQAYLAARGTAFR